MNLRQVLAGLMGVLLIISVSPTPVSAESPDDITITIDVRENGSAVWEVEYRYDLNTENETKAFDSLQNDIQTNSTQYESDFKQKMQSVSQTAENETGRQMEIRNTTVSTQREDFPESTGIVRYTFVWTNFSDTTEGTIEIGEPLHGFYLSDKTTLRIEYPKGYNMTSVSPPTDKQSKSDNFVVWEGPLSFSETNPNLVIDKVDSNNSDNSTNDSVEDNKNDNTGISEEMMLGVLIIVIISAVAGALTYKGGLDGGDDPETQSEETENGSDLISNEEKVIALLEENSGRMKQKDIVNETGWSDAKTSNVITNMVNEGEIEKFQLGRENVVSLPDTEVDPTDDLED